jgi:predicted nucleotidyltransferase
MNFPEKINGILKTLTEDLKSRESISSIGLFGSWSRGDATPSSDIDLLIIDNRDFDFEYIERAKIAGYFFDFNYIPKKWILRIIPSQLDQKLYETQIFFDKDQVLTNAKKLTEKIYWEPERVDIRTESYLIVAQTYLTRARLSFNKEDFQSTKFNVATGIEPLMKVLLEINKKFIKNSHLVQDFEKSAKKLGMPKIFKNYVNLMGFSKYNQRKIVDRLNSFSSLWLKAIKFIESNSLVLKTMHFKIKNSLKYYGTESFWKGMLVRTKALIENDEIIEAAHYLFLVTAKMFENYMWLFSSIEGTRFDYSIPFQYLSDSKKMSNEIYEENVETFGLKEVKKEEAEEYLKRFKEDFINIRQKRRALIKNTFGS